MGDAHVIGPEAEDQQLAHGRILQAAEHGTIGPRCQRFTDTTRLIFHSD